MPSASLPHERVSGDGQASAVLSRPRNNQLPMGSHRSCASLSPAPTPGQLLCGGLCRSRVPGLGAPAVRLAALFRNVR